MIALPAIVWFLIGVLIFCVGWNLAVYKFRADQRHIAQNYEKLADRYEELAVLMDQDPTRAGIDVGKDYVIHEIEQLCRDIRESIKVT